MRRSRVFSYGFDSNKRNTSIPTPNDEQKPGYHNGRFAFSMAGRRLDTAHEW